MKLDEKKYAGILELARQSNWKSDGNYKQTGIELSEVLTKKEINLLYDQLDFLTEELIEHASKAENEEFYYNYMGHIGNDTSADILNEVIGRGKDAIELFIEKDELFLKEVSNNYKESFVYVLGHADMSFKSVNNLDEMIQSTIKETDDFTSNLLNNYGSVVNKPTIGLIRTILLGGEDSKGVLRKMDTEEGVRMLSSNLIDVLEGKKKPNNIRPKAILELSKLGNAFGVNIGGRIVELYKTAKKELKKKQGIEIETRFDAKKLRAALPKEKRTRGPK